MKYTLAVLVIITMLFSAGRLAYKVYQPTPTRCGTIVFKGTSDQVYKYSSKTEFLLVVTFPEGREDVKVDLSTWSSSKVGDEGCFKVPFRDRADVFDVLGLFACLFIGLLAIAGFSWGIVESIDIVFFTKN